MNVKSPCIDKCQLNDDKRFCKGCFRTPDEISSWNILNNKQKKIVLRNLKLRKSQVLLFLFFLFFSDCFSNDLWVGNWMARDQWQSEFLLEIKEDGSAKSDYGNGQIGKWSIVDGNLEIIWESGKKDYLFSGVMGYQRLSKNNDNSSYTSGLRKLLD